MVASGDARLVQHDDTTTEEGVLAPKVLWEGQYDWMTIHSFPVADFVQAIREGRQPATSLERALVIQQIIDAIYASAETGKAYEFAERTGSQSEQSHSG